MKKRRVLKKWVKVVLVISVLVIVGLLVNFIIQHSNRKMELEHKHMVEVYITCLNDNFTQRDYCARQQGTSYYLLDQLLEKEGYTYKQVGYDLYVVEK